jgi:antitoxin component YwqK of YwqJK toxin-antitoxin module
MRASILILAVLLSLLNYAQEEVNPNGYNVFYYENGQKSSEGYMVDGKPEGYWKTYNEEGILVAEGNRKDFELDSTWRFYNDDGTIKLEVNYLQGKKNGIRTTFRKDEIIEETFENDIKNGPTRYLYKNRNLKTI